jgi:hypothetical protein
MDCGGPHRGPWARQISRAIQMLLIDLVLLIDLAQGMVEPDELDNAAAPRAGMRLGAVKQTVQLSRISSRHGFKAVALDTINFGTPHRFGENAHLFLLVLATNPITLRVPVLRHDLALVYLARTALERRHGRPIQFSARTRKYRPC